MDQGDEDNVSWISNHSDFMKLLGDHEIISILLYIDGIWDNNTLVWLLSSVNVRLTGI